MEDLAADGTRLRQQIPQLLAAMADEGILQQDGDEYRLQTAAGREWDAGFRRERANLEQDDGDVTRERDRVLREAVAYEMPTRVIQGRSKVSRIIAVHEDDSAPPVADQIPVWLRSEWQYGISTKQFESDALALGADSPIVLIHIPRVQSAEFQRALRDQMAAQRVLDSRGAPRDDEGRQAKTSMESRHDRAAADVTDHVRQILAAVRVSLAGGSQPDGDSLNDRIEQAGQSAAQRLFPRFTDADSASWPAVIAKVKSGSGADGLKAIGYDGEVSQHPVAKAILARVTGSSTPASGVEKELTGAPFGWPTDAIKATIGVLTDNDYLTVTTNGSPADAKQVMAQTRLGKVTLRREATVLTTKQKIEARGTLSKLGHPTDNDGLVAAAEQALVALQDRAKIVSGQPPWPDAAVPEEITAVLKKASNDRVIALLDAKETIETFAASVDAMASRVDERQATLQTVQALADAARELEEPRAARESLRDFLQSRDLLAEANPLSSLEQELAATLREHINDAASALESTRVSEIEKLSSHEAWNKLSDEQRQTILSRNGLDAQQPPALGSPGAVVAAIQQRSLEAWAAEQDAVPARAAKALDEALELTEPSSVRVTVPSMTLRSAEDVDAYLAELRTTLNAALEGSNAVVVKGQ